MMEEGKLDRVLNALKNNQNNILIAGAAVGATALGLYGLKKTIASHSSLNEKKPVYDEYFQQSQVQPLQQSEVQLRDRLISNVGYDLLINLEDKYSKTYSGRVKISFMLQESIIKEDLDKLFIDFHGKKITEFRINENVVPFSGVRFSKQRIMIPNNDALKANSMNHITIKFTNNFVDNSAGLHKFIDPIDKEVYIFSNLQPFYANRWFPCFDQPGLRASLKLTVISPDTQWQIVSNGKKQLAMPLSDQSGMNYLKDLESEEFVKHFEGEARNHATLVSFEETPSIGTYSFALYAGRFKCYIDNEIENIPMRIFVRESKHQYFTAKEAKELFRIIQVGIAFYDDFFGVGFPFKYDQVFCPDLRGLGMECLGAVALNENEFLVPHEESIENQRFNLAFTALKLLANQWFGNLVGLKWWNDLWMKESLSTYMAAICMQESQQLSNYAHTDQIFVKFLFNAVSSDIKSTTHPIQATVKHTIDAENVFNNISLDKGASFFKMLNNFIGRDAFKLGLKEYFSRFKYQNTEMKDLIQCLQIASAKLGSNQDVRLWALNWLTKAGINQFIPVIEKDINKGTYSVGIRQSHSKFGDPVLKEQIIDIALYDQDCNETLIKNIRLRQMEVTPNVVEGRLEDFPAAILINANNRGYGRVILDNQSQIFFLNNLSKIKSDVNRAYIWKKLFDQVKNKLLKAEDYLECVFTHLIQENSELMLPLILEETRFVLNYYFSHAERKHYQLRYQKCLIDKMSTSNSISQKNLLATALLEDTIFVERDHDQLVQWLDLGRIVNQNNNSVGAILNQSHRYQILRYLHKSHRFSDFEKERRRNHEIQLGGGLMNETMLNQQIALDTVNTHPSNKQKLWNQYVEGNMVYRDFKLSSRYFYDHDDDQMCIEYGDKFFEVIERIFLERHRDYAETFFKNLSPTFLGREVYLDRLIQILERATKTENTHFINLLKDEIELMEQIIEIRSLQKVPL